MSLLGRFRVEVLKGGAESCLPRNLPDEWVLQLIGAVDDLLNISGVPEDPEVLERTVIAACAVRTILMAKYSVGPEVPVPSDLLLDACSHYRIELDLEKLHRSTVMKYEPATLETIFTPRSIRTWEEPLVLS
jgi:hypothetical protein